MEPYFVGFLAGIVVGLTLGVLLMAIMMSSRQSARETPNTASRVPREDNTTELPPPDPTRE